MKPASYCRYLVTLVLFGVSLSSGMAQARFDYLDEVGPDGREPGVMEDSIEPWPSSYTVFENDYNYIMRWRDFFLLPFPTLVVVESIPDSLPYENWGTPRPFVDEDGGGEPFDIIEEKWIIKRYKMRNQKVKSWTLFIRQVHQKWTDKYRRFFHNYFDSATTEKFISKIDFNYYDISYKNYQKYKKRDHYDKLKVWLFQQVTTHINSVQNNLDSLLFSKKYQLHDANPIPASFMDFVNVVLEREKEALIADNDSTYYKAVRDVAISYQPVDNTTLWFSNSIQQRKIFISPVLLRTLFTIAFNKYENNPGQDFFDYSERFVNYDFFYRSRLPNGELNYVDRTQNTLQNVRLFNKVFYVKFEEGLSFILHHELAHIYLGKNGIPELSELRCDCYAQIFCDQSVTWRVGTPLGIFNNLLRTSIKENRPDIWGLDNIMPLRARFAKIDSLADAQLTPKQCDSMFLKH